MAIQSSLLSVASRSWVLACLLSAVLYKEHFLTVWLLVLFFSFPPLSWEKSLTMGWMSSWMSIRVFMMSLLCSKSFFVTCQIHWFPGSSTQPSSAQPVSTQSALLSFFTVHPLLLVLYGKKGIFSLCVHQAPAQFSLLCSISAQWFPLLRVSLQMFCPGPSTLHS